MKFTTVFFNLKMKYLFSYVFCILNIVNINSQMSYTENFDTPGIPTNVPQGTFWKYFNDIHPPQNSWQKFIPGDGFAYIKVDADVDNDTDYTYPYQTLVFAGVGENHRLEVRMKGAVVNGGLVGFLFTYVENGAGTIFNEVDIEVVANDRDVATHETLPPNGWTDARFNTWRNASTDTYLPFTGSAKPVVGANNTKISLIDNQFHTYTIDWRQNQVDFFIDGVLQDSFNTNVAQGWSEVIIGFRQLPWAKDFNWSGTHELVMDYFKIEPLSAPLSTEDFPTNLSVAIFPNPTNEYIKIISKDFQLIKKIELFNALGKQVFTFDSYIPKIDMSKLPKGLYFVNVVDVYNKMHSQKIVKN